MFDTEYKTISKISEGIYREKGSKFIGLCYPVESDKDTKEIIANIQKEYHDARHHCYAYRLYFDKSVYRINDDGEPSGTAGKPIYGQILSNDLTNVLIIVVRYFGGVKLGVGGLINAYKTAAAEAISNNIVVSKKIKNIYNINFQYPQMNNIMNLLKSNYVEIIENNFFDECNITFSINKSESDKIVEVIKKIENTKIQFLKTI